MYKKSWKIVACSMGIFAVTASSCVFAGNRPGAVTVGVGEGYYFFAQKRHLNNTTVPSVRLGYDISETWGIFAGADLLNSTIKGAASGNPPAHGFIYSLDLMYHFCQHGRFSPYLLAGPGITSLKPAGNSAVDNASINFGIGAQYFIDPLIALGADLRDIYTLNGGINDAVVSFGITFVLGGASSTVSQPVYKPVSLKDEI